jgi:hypothetical protein
MEPEGSLPYSQKLRMVPILSLMHPVNTFPPYFRKIHSNIILPTMSRSSEWYILFRFSNQHFVCVSCYMSRPCHPPWFDHPNNIWWSVQVMMFFVMQSSPASRHFLPLRSKCSQHPVLRHPQSMLFPWCERPGFTPVQNNRQNYSSVYVLIL